MTVRLTELGKRWLAPQQAALVNMIGRVVGTHIVHQLPKRLSYTMFNVRWLDGTSTWCTASEIKRRND